MHSCLAAERYTVTALPFIPFSNTGGEALNDHGVVAGGIANSDGSVSLAAWSEGALTDLGVAPGVPSRHFDRPRVFGINNSGTIVGTVHTSAGDLPSRWFVHEQGRFNVLPLADPTDLGGAAIGINDRGEVVGYDHTSDNRLTAWLWARGAYSRLPISGTSVALGINSTGTIIGNRSLRFVQRLLTGQFRGSGQRGYVLSGGATRYLNGFVNAINDAGEAVGGSTADGTAKAAIFRAGTTTVIVNGPGSAVGINTRAQVVGSWQPSGDGRRHLFIWSAGSGALDLTPEDYRSAEAAAINDRGDVLGYGETQSGQFRYFLLTPSPGGGLTPKPIDAAPRARPE